MSDELAMDSKALIFATLADVYLSSGMIDEAISILKDGLTRNPNYTLAKIILGRAYYLKGDTENALKTLEDIYEQARDSENENLYLGHIYKKLGDYEKAMKFYETTLRINPDNKDARQELELLSPKAQVEVPITRPLMEEQVKTITPEMVAVPKEETPGQEQQVAEITENIEPEVRTTIPPEPISEIVSEPEPGQELKSVVPPDEIPASAKEEVAAPILPEIGLESVSEERKVEKPSPLDTLNEPMKKLLDIEAVRGAFILSRDGLLIQSYYEGRTDLEEICALIAGIFNEADNAFKFLKAGTLGKCVIEKIDETICVITAGESLLCIVTKPETKPGLVFVYARRIIEEIIRILG